MPRHRPVAWPRWGHAAVQLAVALCALLGLAAQASGPIEVRDDAARVVRLAQAPQRVVSLLPSLTESVCVLGACERLVATDRYSNWPHAVLALPKVGGGLDPNIEAVVAARPDLVLLASSTRAADRLRALGLTVLALEPNTQADAQRVLRTLGQALGLPEAAARDQWARIEQGVAQARARLLPAARGLRVYVEVSSTPHGAGEASFIGQLLKDLGAHNILPASMGPFPVVNPEHVVQARPQVVLVGDSSQALMRARPGWSDLPAMQAPRLCALSPAQADVLMRPGPRMAEAAQLVVDCLNRSVTLPGRAP